MDVLLIPGFWLDASSWEQVTPPLVAAGHTVHPLTLPGLESPGEDRRQIGFAEHVAAVVAAIDALPGRVALVGHSGGGTIAGAAVDARPDRVEHVVYVDSGPLNDGAAINDGLPAVDGEIPLPDWTAFDESELAGLDEELRQRFRDRAIPEPARVASDPVTLSDERRLDVPATVISSTMPTAVLEELMEKGHPYVAELARVRRRAIVELPTGHWPQFSRPQELGEAIVAALADPPR
ncbi:alpha/beta fold hydrolase [Naasia sp. SYSU D00057]|uniref:alpha/beta fold hydrolase n=1 Tax=Naasia sp. SYSU D00057 TaxID=2817380 RepID=UPI001B30F7B8|nr:alpha/beta hydrolase [Naasia sp. SYSU D00057]